MKKYGILFFTIIVLLTTAIIFQIETSETGELSHKKPEMNLQIKEYGVIDDILWSSYDNNRLLFIANKNDVTVLYSLNMETNEIKQLFSTDTHPILKNTYQYYRFNGDTLYIPGPNGLFEIKLSENHTINSQFHSLNHFEAATSFFVSNKIFYTRKADKLVYSYSLPNSYGDFSFFSPNNNSEQQINYLKNPYQIIFASNYREGFYYTKWSNNILNMHYFYKEQQLMKDEIVLNNIISAEPDSKSMGIIGLIENEAGYSVYWYGNYNDDDREFKIVDTIPKNTSLFDQLPSITATYSTLGYTKFDEKHQGTIYLIDKRKQQTIELIGNQPIVGPLRINESGNRLLFYTYEDKELHIKIFDLDQHRTIDITKMFFVTGDGSE